MEAVTSDSQGGNRREPFDVPDQPEPPPIEKDSPDSDEHNRLHGATVPARPSTIRNITPRVIE